MSSTLEPPSVGRSKADPATESAAPDAALLRLHAALKNLDTAIFDALRCLDVALGRNPASMPPPGLPHRELGRLELHLEAATAPQEKQPDRNLSAMALSWDDDESEAHQTSATGR